MGKYRYAVLDIETTGLDRFTHSINYIGIGLAEDIGCPLTKSIIINMHSEGALERFHRVVALLKRDKVKLIWQNGKFDTLFMEHHYNITLPLHYDVMVMGTAYDLVAKHGLDAMAAAYLGVPSWDIPLKEKIKPNNPIVEKYLEKDLRYPWELFCFFFNNLNELQWKHHDYLLKPAVLMYRKIERNGIYLDRKRLKIVRKEYKIKQAEKLAELIKHYDINWNSPAQVSDALFGINGDGLPPLKLSAVTGKPSADAKVLKRLAARGYDLPTKLLDYKMYYGALTKFLNKWGDFAAYDGRIHPSFNVTNVITGRPSCSNPNLQQVPRLPALRTLFTANAEEGRSLIEADYSQIELRIAADDAKDPTMINIYMTGGDIHTATAQDLSGKKEPSKEDRSKAKPVNFGFLYGMMAKGFVNYSFDNYGVVFTMQEAERYRQLFFNKYSRLAQWHEDSIERCRAHGGVENRFGRFCSIPDIYSNNWSDRGHAERRSINTPVQSTASDLLVFAAIEIDHKLSREMDLFNVGTIHDAILIDCPDNCLKDAQKEIKKIMSHPEALDIFGVEFKLPIEADVGVGAWGSK